jgi:hypothetical protein
MPNVFKRTNLLFILPLVAVTIGTLGFMAIEKLSFINALYFTFVTVSTVGYGDIHPVSTAGKLFAIFTIVIGIGSFLAIVTNLTQSLVASGEARLRKIRINMLIGLYFTEVGNQLLRILVPSDPDRGSFRKDFLVNSLWAAADFEKLKAIILKRENNIDPKLVDVEELLSYLKEKGEFLSRQLENPDLTENESFCDLLWASVHLRDELMARPGLSGLPDSDLNHLTTDAKRVYNLLVKQWLDYMRHLQNRYPYQFSLAVRTNPFSENPSVTIT